MSMRVMSTLLLMFLFPVTVYAAPSQERVDPFMGDWKGTWLDGKDAETTFAAQVLALGGDTYEVQLLPALYRRAAPDAVVTVKAADGKLSFESGDYYGVCDGEVFTGGKRGDEPQTFRLERFHWESPTLGAQAPAGATVLFDGSGFEEWARFPRRKSWDILEGGILQAHPDLGYIVSRDKFEDCRLHLEFRTPFMPDARGQGRANSGVFVQRLFEVQILDSYALPGYWNECGSIYKQSAPRVNMCLPPMQWQTYDITFRAARYDADDKLAEHARMTLVHNGVTVQDNVEIPHGTSGRGIGAHADSPDRPEPIRLQAHNNRVQFRNIWVEGLEDARP